MIKKDWTEEDKLRANNLLKCVLKMKMWKDSAGSDGYVIGASVIWLKDLITLMETPVVPIGPKDEKDMPARLVKGDNKNAKKTNTKKETRKSPPQSTGKGSKDLSKGS